MSERSELLEAALQYAEEGLAIIPLRQGGKKPFLEKWPLKGTTDKKQIKDWWSNNPEYNIAFTTGEKYKLLVIDLDSMEALDFLKAWLADRGLHFPEKLWVAKSIRGFHLYFALDRPLKNSESLFFEGSGIDVRGEGGCICAPPSIRDGGQYEWVRGPEDFPLALANENVFQFIWEGIEAAKKSQAATKGEDAGCDSNGFELPAEILEGKRNRTLFEYACSLQGKGVPDESIFPAVREVNVKRCKPPLPEREVRETVKSALNYDKGGGTLKEKQSASPEHIVKQISFVQADELVKMELEKTFFVVEEMIPSGLSIVASPPKYGKSWLVLDMCIAVAAGSDFLGHCTNQSGVLYLALEDSNNRLQDRIKKVLDGRKPPQGLAMSTEAADLGHGLISQLAEFIKEWPETRLIVIDTFEKIRADVKRGESAYSADYREAGELKAFADQNKIALVLVHHTRKNKDFSDSFNNISGTHGLTGAADTMLVLEKDNRVDENTKLSITGRDVITDELQMNFRDYRWRIIGTSDEVEERKREEEYNQSPLVNTIKKLMQQNKDGWSGTASELISASKYFRAPIFASAQKVGRMIDEVAEMLYQRDRIIFEPIKNGTGARRYNFRYETNPFEEEE